MKIRSHLYLLGLGAIAPLVVVLAVGGVVLVDHERKAFANESIGRARAAMSAIDTELRNSLTTLKTLAASKNLEKGDIRAFHAEAQRLLASKPEWRNIELATVAREQLMDANLPPGAPAPFAADEAFDRAVRTGEPAVSNLPPGTAVSGFSVLLRVPVFIGGKVRYVLSAPIVPGSFDALLKAQRLPEGWIIGLLDREKKFISRIPPVLPGTSASANFRAAIERAGEGWFRARTLEGVEMYTPYVTSELSGWVLGIGAPRSVVEAGVSRALWITAAGVLLALGIALALAGLIARRIAEPIAALAAGNALELDVGHPGAQRIEEIARLRDALNEAARAVRERQQRIEHEQAALREQTDLLRQRTGEVETLMQVMPIAVLKTEDLECRTVTGNPAAYRFLKISAGENIGHFVAAGPSPGAYRVLRNGQEVTPQELPMPYAIAHGEESPGEELEFHFADGDTRFGYVYASPLFDAQGKVLGSVCAILDITERKEADRRKDEFLATLAHELRNPLAPVVNALRLIEVAGQDPAATTKAHEILRRQVPQMKRLIDDLMDVSRISQGKIVLRREQVALQPVIDEVLDACQPAIEVMGHDLKVSLPAFPVWLDCDATRLAQMLTNLLGNACKFTPRKGDIRIEASCQGAELVVAVSDNGMGIAPEFLPRVFDLFTQGDRSLERTPGGLGIGLSLVQRLAELHGGTVAVRSGGIGMGAEFVMRLPIGIDAGALRRTRATSEEVKSAHYRILVVDDNNDAAESLAELLKMTGHEVHIANDGLEGVEAAGRLRPEIVLMDIGMPRLNGYDAARRMREESWGAGLFLVAISGWGQPADRQKASEAGFDAHLVKPVEYANLLSLFEKWRAGEPLVQ